MSTYLELCQNLAEECRIKGTGPNSVIQQSGIYLKIVNIVARADLYIQGKWANWDFMMSEHLADTVVSGTPTVATSTYTKPADHATWDLDSFWIDYDQNTSLKLGYIEYREWRKSFRIGVLENDMPYCFTVKPNKDIIIFPPADAVYQLSADYWQKPYAMTENTSLSPIPSEFHEIIVAKGKMVYGVRESSPEIFTEGELRYSEIMENLEASQLPGQQNRSMSEGEEIIVRPE